MERLGLIIERIALVGGHVSAWLVPVMIALVFFEVFMRYVLRNPPMIADEFSAYMLVAVAFLGMAQTWKEKGHVRISAVIDKLPTKAAAWVRLMSLVLAFAMVIAFCQSSYDYLKYSFKINMSAPTLHNTPLQVPQMALLIGFILVSLIILTQIAKAISNIRHGYKSEEETK